MDTKHDHSTTLPIPGGEAAIVELTRHMSESWDRGDAGAYGDLFSDESDYVAFDGTTLSGRPANVAHHRFLFDTILKGTRLVFEGMPTIRFLSADVAIMHAMGSVLMPWQSHVTPKRRSIQTYVVQRSSQGHWRIEAFHNSRNRPIRMPGGFALKMIVAAMKLRTRLSNPQQRERC
jgi:uncharacterized protein (TIGR02246 family)